MQLEYSLLRWPSGIYRLCRRCCWACRSICVPNTVANSEVPQKSSVPECTCLNCTGPNPRVIIGFTSVVPLLALVGAVSATCRLSQPWLAGLFLPAAGRWARRRCTTSRQQLLSTKSVCWRLAFDRGSTCDSGSLFCLARSKCDVSSARCWQFATVWIAFKPLVSMWWIAGAQHGHATRSALQNNTITQTEDALFLGVLWVPMLCFGQEGIAWQMLTCPLFLVL